MSQGYLALVLHAHLPYVRHPEHEFFLEEDWLYEAITESYIPLLQAFERMAEDDIPFRLSLSMSPTLVSMLTDPVLRDRYEAYLHKLEELVGKEMRRVKDDGHLCYLVDHYRDRIDAILATWHRHDGNLVNAFGVLQEQGYLDILTCAATHGYLPLMQVCPEAVWVQIKLGVDHYTEHFGRPPTGIWLPECGYYPGVDTLLAEAGLRYFVADSHALLLAEPRPRDSSYAPVFCAGSGVAVFGRDPESSHQVWSREHGYPGDPVYREFYRDIGYDLGLDYIGPYVQPNGLRKSTGIKYHRITGPTDIKELYDPYWAREKADEHAAHFVASRQHQIEHLHESMARPPVVTAPFDAELFGHWWYEGAWWLELVLRRAVKDQQVFRLTHMAEYLRSHSTHQLCRPAQSSWGDRGFHAFWLNSTNEWIYPHLHSATERMICLAADYATADGVIERALNQAARELLLAQSSDWAFIMRTNTMVDYAIRRTRTHLRRFNRLHGEIREGQVEQAWLSRLEYLDDIFPKIDYRAFRPRGA